MGSELERRRFTDQEFALILRRAQELQDGGAEGGRAGSRAGLSLAEIRQIAGEVGIDARYVELAAENLPVTSTPAGALIGAPWQWEVTRVVGGELPEAEKGRVLDAIRSVMKEKGELETAYGRVEWTYDDQLGPLLVRVVPDRGETRVEVSALRSGEAGLAYILPTALGGMIGGAALAGLFGVAEGGAAPFMVGMAGVSFAAARVFWRARAASWERKVALLAERVTEAVRRGLADPGAKP